MSRSVFQSIQMHISCWGPRDQRVVSCREFTYEDPADGLAQALVMMDGLIMSQLENAPLLVDRIAVEFSFVPEIPRGIVASIYNKAALIAGSVVRVLPEDSTGSRRTGG